MQNNPHTITVANKGVNVASHPLQQYSLLLLSSGHILPSVHLGVILLPTGAGVKLLHASEQLSFDTAPLHPQVVKIFTAGGICCNEGLKGTFYINRGMEKLG